MTRISTKYIASIKTIFPVLWFSLLGCFVAVVLAGRLYEKDAMALLVPCMMAIGGIFYMKVYAWVLVDEVYDCGDFLLVKNRGKEEAVPLSNIININTNMSVKPSRITLKLAKPGKFGAEISFAPPPQFNMSPFAKNDIAEDLIIRANKARAKGTAHDID